MITLVRHAHTGFPWKITTRFVINYSGKYETVCVRYDKLERNSVYVEVRYEELVEKLKNELCSVIHMNQEVACLEVEDLREEIDDGFVFDVRDDFFGEREEDKESEEDVEIEEMEESKEEKEQEESEENMNIKMKICYVDCLINNV